MLVTAPALVRRPIDVALEATVVLSFSRIGYEVRSRLERWGELAHDAGTGQHVLVTGANSGIGFATARGVLRAGADVTILVRSHEKGEDTVSRLSDELGHDVRDRMTIETADLLELDSVRAAAARLVERDEPFDAVVHNAGAMFDERELTVDGLERSYQLHVVGPFLLTSLLLPLLRAPARVLWVTSGGMYAEALDVDTVDSPAGYRPAQAYARAKRAQVALVHEWSRRFRDRGLRFDAAHPGWVLTPGVERSLPRFRTITGPVLRDPGQGADTTVWLALSPEIDGPGRLWHDRHPRLEHKVPWTREDGRERRRLWQRVADDAGIDPTP
jgi:dehydrogenase/reductase SDR family member 12